MADNPKRMLRRRVSLALMLVLMRSALPTWAEASTEACVRRLVAALEDSDQVRSDREFADQLAALST